MTNNPIAWHSTNQHFYLTQTELDIYLSSYQNNLRPYRFWNVSDRQRLVLSILRYQVEVIHKAHNRHQILECASDDFIQKAKIRNSLNLNRLDIYDAFYKAFPEHEILPWEIKAYKHYWQTYGDTAIKAAMKWWLAKRHFSVQSLIDILESRQVSILQMLKEDHMMGAYVAAGQNIRKLLHIADPSIPLKTFPSSNQTIEKLVCPICFRKVRHLSMHVDHAHKVSATELKEAGYTNITKTTSRHYRESNLAKPDRLKSVLRFTKTGLIIPVREWPTSMEYIKFVFDPERRLLVLTPTSKPGENILHLQKTNRLWRVSLDGRKYGQWLLQSSATPAQKLRRIEFSFNPDEDLSILMRFAIDRSSVAA